MPENIIDHADKGLRLGRLVYIFIGAAFLLLMVWMMMPPPMFSGIALIIFIAYILSLIGVSISSFTWIARFGNTEPNKTNVFRTRAYMVAWLVISIFLVAASAFFAVLALAVSGLFGMI